MSLACHTLSIVLGVKQVCDKRTGQTAHLLTP